MFNINYETMKKLFLIGIAVAISSLSYAQKVQYEQAQSRILEPLQDVFVRPMVAEMKMLSTELKVYMASWQFPEKKITEITWQDLRDAKANAAFHAAISDGADIIVGATYYVRNHIDEKGKASDHGVDVIVRGYPAKYVNWHPLGDSKYAASDEKWVNQLIEAKKARVWHNNKDENQADAIENYTKN